MIITKFEKVFVSILVFSSILVLCKYIVVFTNSDSYKPQKDLYIYLTAAQILHDGHGSDLYSMQLQTYYQANQYGFDLALPFRYPPLTAMLFLPLSQIKPMHVYTFFAFLNTLMMFMGIYLVLPKNTKTIYKALIYKLIFTALPIVSLTHLGQIYGLTFILVALIYKLITKNMYYTAGMIAGLLFLKPQMLLVIPFLLILIKARKQFTISFLLTLFVGLIISALISGIDFLPKYISFITSTETSQLGSHPETMLNLYNVFLYLFNNNKVALFANIIIYVFLLYLVWANRKRSLSIVFSISVLLAVFASPHNTSIDYLLLGIVCVFQLATKQSGITKLINILVLVSLFVLPVFTYIKILDIKLEIITVVLVSILKLMEADVVKLIDYLPLKKAGISYLPSESESPGFH